MSTRTDLDSLLDDIFEDDPRRALIAFRKLTQDELPWIEQRVVALARREDWNWARIGRLLGRSRSAMQQRFTYPRIKARPDPYAATKAQEAALARYDRRSELDSDPVAW
jgi:hypothetical protein